MPDKTFTSRILSIFMKNIIVNFNRRFLKPIRVVFSFLDKYFVGELENIDKRNADRFRAFLKVMIDERRVEMKDPKFKETSWDFLTILLSDELFAGSDEMIIEECCAFMVAATQTTQSLIENTMFLVTQHKQEAQKIRNELQKVLKKDFRNLSDEEWLSILTQESLAELEYTGYVL